MAYIPVAGPWIIHQDGGSFILENVLTKEFHSEPAIARYSFLEDVQLIRDKLNAADSGHCVRQIQLTITRHGIPKVCSDPLLAAITHEGPGIVTVEFGLDRCGCEVMETSSNHHAPGLAVLVADSYDPTFILFPEEFCGWTVYVSRIYKDLLRACLTKED